MEPVAKISNQKTTAPLRLELSPIEFPIYLDRPQIVSRNRDNVIQIAAHDRWAEPLQDNLTRTLKENLFKQLSRVQISSAPWNQTADSAFIIKLIVNRFDGIIAQQTDVDIRWSLYDTQTNQELISQQHLAKLPINGGYQGLVDGLNAALAELSEEIAAALVARQQ